MDSQVKYGCLARSEGAAYLRMPTGVGYQEKIWVTWLYSLMLPILTIAFPFTSGSCPWHRAY